MGTTFGGADRYYDSADDVRPVRGPKETSPTERRLVDLLPPDTRAAVENAFKAHNAVVRTHLRNETGLDLIHGESRLSVSVTVEEGLPGPLAAQLQSMPRGVLDLILRSGDVAVAANVVAQLTHRLDDIAEWRPDLRAKMPAVGTLQEVAGFLNALSGALEGEDLLSWLRELRQDIFGAYYFRQQRVALFWLPIGLFANRLGLRTEDLAVVVLIHELAHAYTHLGADVDGRRWDTKAFADADDRIVEGLAQFYTDVITAGLAARLPGVRRAFEVLLAKQGPAYTSYLDWRKASPANPGEPVRAAMIEARNAGDLNYRGFERRVSEAATRLR